MSLTPTKPQKFPQYTPIYTTLAYGRGFVFIMPNKEVFELPRIRRAGSTPEGKLLKYVLDHPSGAIATDVVMRAVGAFWMPLALKAAGISEERLKEAVLVAVGELESQALLLKRLCGMEMLYPPISTVSPAVAIALGESNFQSVEEVGNKRSLINQSEQETDNNGFPQVPISNEVAQHIDALGWNAFE